LFLAVTTDRLADLVITQARQLILLLIESIDRLDHRFWAVCLAVDFSRLLARVHTQDFTAARVLPEKDSVRRTSLVAGFPRTSRRIREHSICRLVTTEEIEKAMGIPPPPHSADLASQKRASTVFISTP